MSKVIYLTSSRSYGTASIPSDTGPQARSEAHFSRLTEATSEAVSLLEASVARMRQLADVFEDAAERRRFHNEVEFIHSLIGTARLQIRRLTETG